MKIPLRRWFILAISACLVGCGHVQSSKVSLLSFGDLEGKSIPASVAGPTVSGTASSSFGGRSYYLSDAVRSALKGTPYDTIVDAEVTTRTGVFVGSNEVEVKGTALNSKALTTEGSVQ